MLFGNDRREMRRHFVEAWRRARAGEPLEPLQRQLAALIEQHPEYHPWLENPDAALERDWGPEHGQVNPFLHLGMHVAIQEQVSTDRPPGVREVWDALTRRLGGAHEAEHAMMEALGEALWQAQREQRMPDEAAYLAALRRLADLPPE